MSELRINRQLWQKLQTNFLLKLICVSQTYIVIVLSFLLVANLYAGADPDEDMANSSNLRDNSYYCENNNEVGCVVKNQANINNISSEPIEHASIVNTLTQNSLCFYSLTQTNCYKYNLRDMNGREVFNVD